MGRETVAPVQPGRASVSGRSGSPKNDDMRVAGYPRNLGFLVIFVTHKRESGGIWWEGGKYESKTGNCGSLGECLNKFRITEFPSDSAYIFGII